MRRTGRKHHPLVAAVLKAKLAVFSTSAGDPSYEGLVEALNVALAAAKAGGFSYIPPLPPPVRK